MAGRDFAKPDALTRAIGRRLRKLRHEAGYENVIVAALDCDIKHGVIARMEAGEVPITIDRLVKLSKLYRFKVHELVQAAESDPPEEEAPCSAE